MESENRVEVTYFDEHDNAVDEEHAKYVMIREYDKKGVLIQETIGEVGNWQ